MAQPVRIMGLDLGTTKVSAIMAEIDGGGKPTVIGVGTKKCEGVRKGVIVDIDKTVAAIEQAVAEAEIMAGCSVHAAFTSISGDHIKGMNSTGVVAVSRPEKEITLNDVERVVTAARAVVVPSDRMILHVIPQEFVVDDQDGIDFPVGMAGIRLEVRAHIITGAATCVQNVIKSVKKAGIDVAGLVLQPLATGTAILTPEEMDLGVAVVDIGGGTTDISIFKDGAIRYTAILGLGGNNITNDMVVGLRTPFGQAESIKIEHGATRAAVADDGLVGVEGVQGRRSREISKRVIAQIIDARLDDIFSLVKGQLRKSEYYEVLGAGVVLTGGASLLRGIEDLAEEVLSIPARVGTPEDVGGLREYVRNPKMSTGVGLLHYAGNQIVKGGIGVGDEDRGLGNVAGKVRRWFRGFF
ncbi:MAG: cell division protein FtsA [Candidatus Eisenbacteria bacterium]